MIEQWPPDDGIVWEMGVNDCYTRTSRRSIKNFSRDWKTKKYLTSCSFKGKGPPPSIMITKNPDWSTEILWYGTGYAKGKILSTLKRPT